MKRNRPLTENYEEVGLLGEWAFACFSGIMPKLGRGDGDGGWDFILPCVFTVDVKTSRRGDVLLVEAGKVKADIYVLAHYVGVGKDGAEGEVEGGQWEGDECRLVGWTSAYVIKQHEPRDTGRGVINHAVPASELRPMKELERMMGR